MGTRAPLEVSSSKSITIKFLRMTQQINIDGIEHGLDTLSGDAKSFVARIQDADACIQEMKNLNAIFTRAKRSYIDELRREIIKGKSGVDIATLFD